MKTIKVPSTKKEMFELLDKRNYDFIHAYSSLSHACDYLLEQENLDQSLLYQMEDLFRKHLNLLGYMHDPKHDYKGALKPYPCIPMPVDRFLELLVSAIKLANKKRLSFLDAGCGVGDKVRIASAFPGITAYGIENSKVFQRIAQAMTGSRIILGDITKSDYSRYDIVYAYNPMTEIEGMELFFQKLLDTVKTDTICIFANVGSGYTALRNVNERNEPLGKKFVEVDYDENLYKLEVL